MRILVSLLVVVFGWPAWAEAPETSLVPPVRPAALMEAQDLVLSLSTMSPQRSARPLSRPAGLVHKAMAQRDRRRGGGGLCGDPDIQGEMIPDVPGRIAGCGITDAVKVHALGGVGLSQPAMMNCASARVLSGWVRGGLRKAVGKMGGGVVGLKVAAHYSCRTRNHQRGAPVSEHGKGNAIDISELRLQNGDTLNVLRDWGGGAKGQVLRKVRDSGCGPFGTVLGPGSDGFHRDHFHFDTAHRRSRAYCR
ncbi:MAG: extensin family protein [Rhodobacteraceae bacterium]|nr:MAG: extensin family protein [Paracoccaceae bacterium]